MPFVCVAEGSSAGNDGGNCSWSSGSSSKGVCALVSMGVLIGLLVVVELNVVESGRVRFVLVSDGEPGGVGSKIGDRKERFDGGSKIFGDAGEIGVSN